jgi:hypothetical protein
VAGKAGGNFTQSHAGNNRPLQISLQGMEFNICFMEISNPLTAYRLAQGFVPESATGHLEFGAKTQLLDPRFLSATPQQT